LKLYVNYKIIKRYLQNKKKSKIFYLLKKNTNRSKELDKKGCLLNYILISKNFINKLKIGSLILRNKKYNNQLSNQFYRNLLLKKIFRIISNFYKNIRKIRKNNRE
jgi:hypothetical protein